MATTMARAADAQPAATEGLLVFYRWKVDTPFEEAEAELFPGFADLAKARGRLTMLSIYHGKNRGKEDPVNKEWAVEVRAAIACLYLSELQASEMQAMQEAFRQQMSNVDTGATHPGTTRSPYRDVCQNQKPSSSIAWPHRLVMTASTLG